MVTDVIKKQFIRFCTSGMISAFLDVGTVTLLATVLPKGITLTMGFLLGLVANFSLHHYYTFQQQSALSFAVITKFLLIVIVNYLLMLTVVNVVLYFIPEQLAVAKIISLPIVTLNGLMASRWFIYPENGER